LFAHWAVGRFHSVSNRAEGSPQLRVLARDARASGTISSPDSCSLLLIRRLILVTGIDGRQTCDFADPPCELLYGGAALMNERAIRFRQGTHCEQSFGERAM
jgi:hypothetical protein